MEKTGIIKIAVVGAESTGKSWLCERLAGYYRTAWVAEYAREYFDHSDIYNYTWQDLERIAEKQIQMEDAALAKANGFLFCDTNLVTLKIWAELEFGKTPPLIASGLNTYEYSHTLITDNSQPWEEDHLRQNKFSRELIFEMNVAELKRLNAPFSIVRGAGDDRLKNAITILNKLPHN